MLDLDTCERLIGSLSNILICIGDREGILGASECRIDETLDILIIVSLRFEGKIFRKRGSSDLPELILTASE